MSDVQAPRAIELENGVNRVRRGKQSSAKVYIKRRKK
jgi:hypothetical protein